MTKKQNKELEDFKYLIDSRNLSAKDKKADRAAITKARLDRLRQRSEYDIKLAKLMQLKLQMEEYVKNPDDKLESSFADFLRLYVDTIYSRRNRFAQDISIKPTTLSQVINKHREPQNMFIERLTVHSEHLYKSVCEFDQSLWYNVFYYEKVNRVMSSEKQWKKRAEKFVTSRTLKASE